MRSGPRKSSSGSEQKGITELSKNTSDLLGRIFRRLHTTGYAGQDREPAGLGRGATALDDGEHCDLTARIGRRVAWRAAWAAAWRAAWATARTAG